MSYIAFLAAWSAIWLPLIAIFFTLYDIASKSESKKHAEAFVQDKSIVFALREAFAWASGFSSRVFGEKLVSLNAFFWSFGLSLAIAIIAFSIAMLTTSDMRYEFKPLIDDWGKGQAADLLHFSVASDFCLFLFCIVVEFIYVTKSRYLLRYITYESGLWAVPAIVAFDFLTTILLFILVTPALILLFAYGFFLIYHAQLNGILDLSPEPQLPLGGVNYLASDFAISESARRFWPSELSKYFHTSSPLYLYRLIVDNLLWQMYEHVQERFSVYHSLAVGFTLNYPESASEAAPTLELMTQQFGHLIGPGEIYKGFNIEYPLTTMMVSAFSTLIWTIFSAIVFFISTALYRTIHSYRVLFLSLHERPYLAQLGTVIAILIYMIGVLIGSSIIFT